MLPQSLSNRILLSILDSKTVTDKAGNVYPLHSNITKEQGHFLWQLMQDNEIQHSLEIGCAFGISTLFICDSLSSKPNPRHVIIDPNQSTLWHGVGVSNLEKAGFHFYKLIEKPSEFALPQLVERGEVFDFAFIDGLHRFESVLIDFFYTDLLLREGGVIAFDDVTYPAVNRALRYILNYPNYRVFARHPAKLEYSAKRKMLDSIKRLIKVGAGLLPERISRELWDDSVFRPAATLGIDRRTIAIQKISSEKTAWDWFEYF